MKMKTLAAYAALSVALFSCQKENATSGSSSNNSNIPQSVISQIYNLGYSTDDIQPANGGYVVEGDIFLSNAQLATPAANSLLRVGDEEQYHTTNLILGLPRTITVGVKNLDPIWTTATDTAIARYNAMNLRIKFQRVASGAQITVTGADLGTGGVLGRSSGFPNTAGNPPDSITINNHPGTFGSNPSIQWLGTIVAHEMGHCIGFRHTDYKNRKYSCGGLKVNEGAAGVGAIWIPGTPKSPKDPASWMLACTDGSNRPFNANDQIALNYLYK